MLFLYGLSDKEMVIGRTKTADLCMNCLQTSKHKVVRKRLFFTLFFVPVIPLHTKYSVMCPRCSYTRWVKRAEVNKISDNDPLAY